jgi:isoprenylcysteine carboxyl methyltransferase (ICMT) family protein YpbQ
VTWWVAYVALLAVLFVRVQAPDAAPPPPLRPAPDEPLALVSWHHRLFYALLLGTPVEALVRGGAPDGRLLGVAAFAAGVAAYRVAGNALGASISPLVSPRPGGALVTRGPYRYLRHPMYLGQALIAVGAPLTLGARWMLLLVVPALAILVVRARREDAALARAFPHEFPHHARQAKRLVPFLY